MIYFGASYFISTFSLSQIWNKQTKKCRAVKRSNDSDRCLIWKSISHLHIKFICQWMLNILHTDTDFCKIFAHCVTKEENIPDLNFAALHPRQRLNSSLDNLIKVIFDILGTRFRFRYNNTSTPKLYCHSWIILWVLWIWILYDKVFASAAIIHLSTIWMLFFFWVIRTITIKIKTREKYSHQHSLPSKR